MTLPRSSSAAARRRIWIYVLVALLHIGLIFSPLWFFDLFKKEKKQEDRFRVKIGAVELSSGPEVGMPERRVTRPQPPPEPEVTGPQKKIPPEPRIPAVKPKPKPKAAPKPKPAPAKKPAPKKPAPKKPVPKRTAVRKPAPKKPAVRKPVPKKPVVKRRPEPSVPVKKSVVKPKVKRRNPMDDVYRDPAPPNLNPRVPAGQRDLAQKYAPKADHKTPGGGRKADEAAWMNYGRNLERYIYSRWTEPPRSLLRGELPETVIEITIGADGKVSSARILRPSGNRSMDLSVQALLANLDLLPRPPEGGETFRITLKTR